MYKKLLLTLSLTLFLSLGISGAFASVYYPSSFNASSVDSRGYYYGALYEKNGSDGVCPSGFSIPTGSEFISLDSTYPSASYGFYYDGALNNALGIFLTDTIGGNPNRVLFPGPSTLIGRSYTNDNDSNSSIKFSLRCKKNTQNLASDSRNPSLLVVGSTTWMRYNLGSVMDIHLNQDYTPDTTPPTITLLGSSSVTLANGASYTDAGATASDDIDGTITSSIVTTGLPINTSISGTYTITYNVTDSAGNHATPVTRTVVVSAPIPSGSGSELFTGSGFVILSGQGLLLLASIDDSMKFQNDLLILIFGFIIFCASAFLFFKFSNFLKDHYFFNKRPLGKR